MHSYQIVHAVLEKHRGLAVKLAGITGKCSEWFNSHGREPKTRNPLQSGNLSEVDHFMTYCRQYQAGSPGAGQELSDLVHAVLTAEFSDGDDVTAAEIHKETAEAVQSKLAGKSPREQKRETIEAIGVLARHVRSIDAELTPTAANLRDFAKAAAGSRNGGKR